jgi:polysaccharide biosynthesis/export protein
MRMNRLETKSETRKRRRRTRACGFTVVLSHCSAVNMKRDRNYVFAIFAIASLMLFVAPISATAQALRATVSGNTSNLSSRPATAAKTLSQPAHADLIPSIAPGTADSRIGADDLLSITVFEAPEMNTLLRVSASGDISMQLLGEVHALGLTPTELQAVLQGLLRSTYMRDPHVSVFIQELQSHAVSVVGSVKMPGVFQIRGPKSLLEVLSMAQGLADDAGDTVSVDRGGEQSESVPSSSRTSKTGGTTGSLQRHELLTKSDAPELLFPGRNAKIENINLKTLLGSSDFTPNVLIRPGDVVKVSRAGIVYVVGEVNKPGGFVLQNNESISILQALALAQGTTHTSAIRETRIIRTDLATGKRTEIAVNLGKIFSGKRPDILLEPKDVVFVPNSAAKSVFYRGSEMALQTAAGVAIYKW